MLPTEKKPDCTRKRKKSEVRASERFSDRYGEGLEVSEPSEGDCSWVEMSEMAIEIAFGVRVGDDGGEDGPVVLKL